MILIFDRSGVNAVRAPRPTAGIIRVLTAVEFFADVPPSLRLSGPVAAHWPPVRNFLAAARGLDPALLEHCRRVGTLYANRCRNAVWCVTPTQRMSRTSAAAVCDSVKVMRGPALPAARAVRSGKYGGQNSGKYGGFS